MATTALPRPFSVQTTVTANNQFTRGSQVINGDLTANGLTQLSTALPGNNVTALAANAATVLAISPNPVNVLNPVAPSGSIFRTLHVGVASSLVLPLISTVGIGYNVSILWTGVVNAAGAFTITCNAADFFSANSVCLMGGIADDTVNSYADTTGVDTTLTITPAGAGGNQGWNRGSLIEFTAISANSWMVRGQGRARGTGDGGTAAFSN